ncbi:hypothetical protein [Thalassospira alkalitolerans]|uniref:hypothetical protein n=1 Tax=Thalassospira alkalitolerans TaxID=1293890 RepID=UPI003AA9D017
MEKHFVKFYSPGTFTAEQTTKEVADWDIATAAQMSKAVTERYGAKPYAFQFVTRSRSDDELNSKETARSNMYFISGKVETISDVEERNDPNERILLTNMKWNGYKRIITSNTPYKWTQPLNDDDVVLSAQEGE